MLKETLAFAYFLRRLTRNRIVAAFALMILAGLTEGLSLIILVPLLATLDPSASVTIPVVGPLLAGLNLDLGSLLVVFVLIVVVQASLTRVKSIYLATVMHRAIDRLRMVLFDSVSHARWEVASAMRPADVNHLMMGQIDRIRSAATAVLGIAQALVMLAIYTVLAAIVSWQMALFAIAVGALLFSALYPIRRRAARFGQELSLMFQRQQATVLEFLTGIRVAKSFVVEDSYRKRLASHLTEVRDKTIGFAGLANTGTLFFQVASAVFAAVFVWVAVTRFALGLPQIAVLLIIFARLAPRFGALQEALQNYFTALPAYRDVHAHIDDFHRAAEVLPGVGDMAPALARALTFENVSMTFENSDRPAVDGLTVAIRQGGMTAVIGPSGSGKSTFADLALGLLRPTGGRILIDDIELTETNRRLWRRSVAFVPQEPFLLNDTIAANLRIAEPHADDDQLWHALEQANAAFVHRLPDRLDTLVGERGSRFSGGERQRIALARALLREPNLLILDEATSALDWENQRAVGTAIDRLRDSLTIINIGHRLSVVDEADQVIAMEEGRIVEQGAFEELARQKDSRLAQLLRHEQRA